MAAQEVEVEVDCHEDGGSPSRDSDSDSDHIRPDSEGKIARAGYWQQEIEGIGGVVKKKLKTRMKVGATVREWEDERDCKDEVLGREIRGEERSWCGWCGRVVWGKLDREIYGCDLAIGH